MKLVGNPNPAFRGFWGAFLVCSALSHPGVARSEVKLAETSGWVVSSDGRVNAFGSHIFGEDRPSGLESLNWVGFNETSARGHANADGKLRRTRIRSGFMPTTLAFNFRNEASPSFKLWARLELGIQIANIKPTEIANDPTWMEPRAMFLDVSGKWGGLRGGRDFGLFGRQNIFLNYELGHGYGLGFPCSYEFVYGGACGHVGFGVIWPDFKPQITYTTPKLGDKFELSIGVFDPRSFPPNEWYWTPLPRLETEAIFNHKKDNLGVKVWANAFWQQLGTTQNVDVIDPDTNLDTGEDRATDFKQDLYAVGGGVQAELGSFKFGATGHTGRGLGPYVLITFNPVALSLGPVANQDKEFRKVSAFLAQVAYHLGSSWLSLGYGQTNLGKVEGDYAIDAVDPPPQLRRQTGISVGLYHRMGTSVVFGLDYFNAHYLFDARFVTDPDGGPNLIEEPSQTVNIVNAGVTLEW